MERPGKRQVHSLECPKSIVGRIIGRNGETIKALQSYTGSLIQIDQTKDPTVVTISGTPHALSLAVSICSDIMKGTFKGFALLRQATITPPAPRPAPVFQGQSLNRPVYMPGYGLIPPSQLYGADVGPMLVQTFGPRPMQAAYGFTQAPMMMGLQPVQLPQGQATGMQQVYVSGSAAGGYAAAPAMYYQTQDFGAGSGLGGDASLLYHDASMMGSSSAGVGTGAKLLHVAGGKGGGGSMGGGAPKMTQSQQELLQGVPSGMSVGGSGGLVAMGGSAAGMGNLVMDEGGQLYAYSNLDA